MKNKLRLLIICSFIFSGCSINYFSKDRLEIGNYNFAYSIDSQRADYISQVFDNGKETFIQVGSAVKVAKLEVFTKFNNKSLPLTPRGGFIVCKGIYQNLIVILSPMSKKGISKEISIKIARNTPKTTKTSKT